MPSPVSWLPRRRRLPSQGMRLSRSSYLFIGATLLIGLIGIDTDVNLLLILFGLCIAALLVGGLAAASCLRNLEISRVAPAAVMAGERFEIRYQITNRRRWMRAYSLHIVDVLEGRPPVPMAEAFVGMLRPRDTITLTLPLICNRRGRVGLDQIAVSTHFPFGLFTKYATASVPHLLMVYPRLGVVRERRWEKSRWADAARDGVARNARGDDEFRGLREYRAGDNPRRIHWRRSARERTLMVREMAQLRTHQVWCVLDTFVPSNDPDRAALLEQAISCAATVACDAIESNSRVGFLCNGEPLLVMPPTGGRDYRLRVLRELAMRGDNHLDRLSERLARLPWPTRWRGPCMLFAARATDDLAESARILGRRLGPTTLYLPGTPAFNAVFSDDGRAGWRAAIGTNSSTTVHAAARRVGARV